MQHTDSNSHEERMVLDFISPTSTLEVRYRADTASMRFKNVPMSTVKELKDLMLYHTPVVAVDSTIIHTNSSTVSDEQLHSYISMLPIVMTPDNLVDDQAMFNYSNSVMFTLKVWCPGPGVITPPGYTEVPDGEVTSSHVLWVPLSGQDKWTQKPHIRYRDVRLAHLRPGTGIYLNCYAIQGTAYRHPKWSAIKRTMFNPAVTITLRPGVTAADVKRVNCPTEALTVTDIENIAITPQYCIECGACRNVATVTHTAGVITLDIVSHGQLTPQQIVEGAITRYQNGL